MSGPYAAAADGYLKAGFHPFPVPAGRKAPPPDGFTGADATGVELGHVERWKAESGEANIAVRLPTGVIGLDVDHYGAKRGGDTLTKLKEIHGPLPATSVSSARTGGASGIRLYRIPAGVDPRDLHSPGEYIDLIRPDHRYLVAPPSLHPEGSHYRWYGPNGSGEIPKVSDLPSLPHGHLEHLFKRCSCYPSSPLTAPYREARWSDPMATYREALQSLAAGDRRHDTVLGAVMALVRWQEGGDERAVRHLTELEQEFMAAVTGDGSRSSSEALGEWKRMLTGARTKVAANPSPKLTVASPAQQPIVTDHLDLGGIIFDQPAIPPALWGNGSEVLAAIGEPTILYSATGIGKTTLAQRILLAAIGIGPPEVLGYPVRQIEGRVLYVAADRPAQAMRSLRRMVKEADRATLDERFRWERRKRLRITPEHPESILEAAQAAEASLLVLDSLKDLVAKVSDEASGQAYNDAAQLCVANGVDTIALHHPRKASGEQGRKDLSLDDVYGSTWITAGAGSVIALNGKAGEGIAKLQHLKMPAEEVGPFDIDFDYDRGTVTTIGRRDLRLWIDEVRTATTAEATAYLLGKPNATESEKKAVRRKLNRLEKDGYATSSGESGAMTVWKSKRQTVIPLTFGPGHDPDKGGRTPTRTGSDTENENPSPARAEGVGQVPGQTRTPNPDTLPPSREGARSGSAAQRQDKNAAVIGSCFCGSPQATGTDYCALHLIGDTLNVDQAIDPRLLAEPQPRRPATDTWRGVVEGTKRLPDDLVEWKVRGRVEVICPRTMLDGPAFGKGDTVEIDRDSATGVYHVEVLQRRDPP